MTELPAGPGLFVRWLAAVPLMAVSMFAPWFGQLALAVWWFDEYDKPFWQEFDEALGDLGWFPVYLPMFVLTWFLLRRTRMAGWPTACLVVEGLLLVPGTLLSLLGIGIGGLAPNLAFAAGLTWLGWELGRQALRVLSWPPAEDLARSELEIVYRVPGVRTRLRVQHDRLTLDRVPPGEKGSGPWSIPLAAVKEVCVEKVAEPTRWYRRIDLPVGHALLVRGGRRQHWRLPVSEDVGHLLVAAIEVRSPGRANRREHGTTAEPPR